jgi:hypothetical protein
MKLTRCKKFASIVGLALGLTLAAGSAQSAVLYSFQDDDIDFIVREGAVVTSGPIAVGDVFVSVFEIPTFTIGGVNAIPAGQELTGVVAVQLVSISCGGVPGPCAGGIGTVYTYAAYSGGLNSILALGTDPDATVGTAGDAGGGAVVAMFFNSTSGAGGDIDLILDQSQLGGATNCTSIADCIDQGSRGTLFQVDGFQGDPDEFWVAIQTSPGGGDIGTVLGTNNTAAVVTVQAAISNFFNLNGTVGFIDIATGLFCGNPGYIADGCVQFTGTGPVTGGQGLSNGAFAHSDFDAQKYVIPEPGTLALLAFGLLGLGAGLRRRIRRA